MEFRGRQKVGTRKEFHHRGPIGYRGSGSGDSETQAEAERSRRSVRPTRAVRPTGAFDFVGARIAQSGRALGKRVWKSRRPTHSGVIVMRTMDEIMEARLFTQAFPCSGPK